MVRAKALNITACRTTRPCGRGARRCGPRRPRRLVEQLLEERDERDEGAGRFLGVRRQQLLGELGHDGLGPFFAVRAFDDGWQMRWYSRTKRCSRSAASSSSATILAQVLGRRAHGLLEEGQQQFVLAGEVLVEATQRLAGTLDDLLHGEVLAGGAVHQLEGRVEEALHPLLGPHPSGIERPGRRPARAS
jgi:hypothetical protein